MERLDVGDLVRWTELDKEGRNKIPKIGIVSDLFLEKRGNRNIALAKVHEVSNTRHNLAPLGREIEVLAVCLEPISKISIKNE